MRSLSVPVWYAGRTDTTLEQMSQPASLVIGQSGGPTPVANASLAGALGAARGDPRVGRVLGARFGMEGVLQGEYVDLTNLPSSKLATLERTPGAALGSSRYRPSDEEIQRAAQDLHARGVRWLAMVGGNDSADILHRLDVACRAAVLPVSVVGIPKTIDNDLPHMDHCPGYGSAARYIALAIREAGLDTAAMQRSDPIKIIEVMGRNSGWLAAAATVGRESPSDPPHVVFLPERPRPLDQMIAEIGAAYEAHGWAVVVVCENQRDSAGRPLGGGALVHVDPYGHPYYEGAGAYLARATQAALGLRARYERPGSLQRMSAGAISATDAAEATEVGAEAVRRALDGQTGVMIAIQRDRGPCYTVSLEAVPLGDVAREERHLPDDFIAPSGIDVTEAFLAYALPLVGAPLPPVGYRL